MRNLISKVLSLGLFVLLCFIHESVSAGCSMKLNGDMPKKEAIFLRMKGKKIELLHPEGPTIELQKNEQLVFACSGSKNYLTALNNSTSVAYGKCKADLTMTFGTKSFPISQLGCDKTITGDIITTKEPCGNGEGTWNKMGFKVHDNQVGWVDLYRVCYDQRTGSIVYAEHMIPGTSVADNQKESFRPNFKSAGTPAHVTPSKAYLTASQKVLFAELLGSEEEAAKYFEGSNAFLSRGHMAPDADFTFAIWAFATYFYVNTCPQWQAVNAGNWLRVENLARKLGSSRAEDLMIYSGVHDVLTLPDINGNDVEMHIAEGGNIIVPKWNWKIIHSPQTYEAIAFVTLNNPYASKVTAKEMLCKSVCKEAGFEASYFENYEKGFTYCCNVADLAKVVKTAPELVVKKLMKA